MLGWGVNLHGQLGLGPSSVSSFIPEPQSIPFFDAHQCTQVACSLTHSLFLLIDGSVYSAGNNEYSQLGREGRTTIPEKVNFPRDDLAVQITCGQFFSVCLTGDGKVLLWGSLNGKINEGDGFFFEKPTYLTGFKNRRIVQIASGYTHCLGLGDDGTVYAVGLNIHGQLGLGHREDVVHATPISCLRGSPIVQIACGAHHSLIISKSGTVFACGLNTSGQLGLGDMDIREWPSNVKGLQQQKVTYAACGEKHSIIVTIDGGVFSFGSGNLGQLGHNSTNDELLPKKIMELMGTEVSQIACGRSHTVIYTPKSGQIWTFGLACSGLPDSQLSAFTTVPQKLPINFTSYQHRSETPNKIVHDEDSSLASKLKISLPSIKSKIHIIGVYAGGHQTFLRVSDKAEAPDDYRFFSNKRPILELTFEFARWLHQAPSSNETFESAKIKLARMFTSEACLNGSFLALPDHHFYTSPTNSGIDLDLVISVMEKLRSCDQSIQQLLSEHIQAILLSLPETAPCFEALRIYLTLPFCHIFENEDMLETVIAPFAQAITRLKKNADGRVLDYWMLKMGRPCIERLLELYKPVVLKAARFCAGPMTAATQQYRVLLESMLGLLKKVHHISSNMSRPELVRHDAFYLKELNDIIDLKQEYYYWRLSTAQTEKKSLYFCDYAFLFDLRAKISLLQYHGQLEMEQAVQHAFLQNLQSTLGAPMEQVLPLLVLHVKRENIVQDTINQMDKYNEADFKKPLKVFFQNEDGLDAGGVKKEFFILLTREILDPKYGMFSFYDETNTIWFIDYTADDEPMYKLIGTLCALAIYNLTIIDLPFPLALYKKLLKKGRIDLDDMKSLSPSIYNSLKSVLDYKEDDLESTLCFSFVIEREFYGTKQEIELKPNGSSIMVNQQNKHEFVELYVDYIFNKSCEKQFKAFSTGFRRVINSKPLELFFPDELMSFVVGNTSYDWNEFQKKAEYKGEYHANHPVIQWFWQVFHKLDEKDKRKFLLFLTGSDRVPVLGWSQTLPMTIQRSHTDDVHLPVSHTCFNVLDLPSYSSKDILRTKLLEAIQHNQGFNLA